MKSLQRIFINGLKLSILLALSLAFIGCGSGGDDGAPGASGPAGPPGGEVIAVSEVQTSLVATITSATFTGRPVVNFSVVDQDKLPYVDLPSIRFTLSKLTPGINGDSSAWQSYINQTETADGNGSGTLDTIQATSDRNGVLENHQDGSYTYTFDNDISQITSPITVAFEPELTHRLAMQPVAAVNQRLMLFSISALQMERQPAFFLEKL